MKQIRLLILRGGAIGDFILTVPAIHALRRRWSDAYIELIGYPHIANLAIAAGLVDHVDSLDRAEMARFFAMKPAFSEEQSRHVRSFDLVVSWLHDPDGSVQNNLLLAGAKQVVYGSPLVDAGHAVDHLLKPLEQLAIYPEPPEVPRLALSAPVVKEGKEWLAAHGFDAPPAALHPGSGSPKKNWPIERFLELADRLEKAGAKVLFIAGEADDAIARELERRRPGAQVLAGQSLVQVAGVLASCRFFLGNDSGITHVAAALGIPVVALFGPTDPDRWGPRGENVCVVRAPGGDLSRIAVEDVRSLVKL